MNVLKMLLSFMSWFFSLINVFFYFISVFICLRDVLNSQFPDYFQRWLTLTTRQEHPAYKWRDIIRQAAILFQHQGRFELCRRCSAAGCTSCNWRESDFCYDFKAFMKI